MPMTSVAAGLLLGLSLIVAIGAQNVFVLRQGLRREHVGLVAAICAVSDAVLILLGVSGIGAATSAVPWLAGAVRWAGAAFLAGYGIRAGLRAIRPTGDVLLGQHVPTTATPQPASMTATPTRWKVALTCLALTWLNPHVYLDTVFLVGSVAAGHGEGRWLFAVGAMTASVLWFYGLAYGARLLGGWLATPRAWRLLDAGIALTMLALSASLIWRA